MTRVVKRIRVIDDTQDDGFCFVDSTRDDGFCYMRQR